MKIEGLNQYKLDLQVLKKEKATEDEKNTRKAGEKKIVEEHERGIENEEKRHGVSTRRMDLMREIALVRRTV